MYTSQTCREDGAPDSICTPAQCVMSDGQDIATGKLPGDLLPQPPSGRMTVYGTKIILRAGVISTIRSPADQSARLSTSMML